MDENRPKLSPEQALEQWRKQVPGEGILRGVAVISGMAPGPGQAISAYISGKLSDIDRRRLEELMDSTVDEMARTSRRLNLEFLKKDDFADLSREIGEKVIRERNADKRKFYRNILLGAVLSQDIDPYDEAMKYSRTLEALQPVHVHVLRAVSIEIPERELWNRDGIGGFMMGELKKRLPELPETQITEILEDLNNERLTKFRIDSLMLGMSGSSAANLRTRVTEYGHKFVGFVLRG